MIPLITPADMRDMERRYFGATGTASIALMEVAARALCDALLARYGADRTYCFACGPGGNGGDGYACARMIRQAGGRAAVVSAAEPTSPDAAENLRRARETGVPEAPDGRPDVWVDALYGTGLSRAPAGPAADLIRRINADRARGSAVVAVDIPSGLNGLTGVAYDPCVVADVTVAFQYAKPGCFLSDGLDVSGEVVTPDIGIPASFYPAGSPALAEDADARAALPKRPRNFHKGMAGHLLIVAGSFGMAGAAAMCAQSALRTGAGLTTVACPASVVPILQTLAPCAMCVPLSERDGALAPEAAAVLRDILPGKSAVVCGCGLSRRAAPEVIDVLLNGGAPTLFDADALNLIAEHSNLKASLRPRHLLTPHPGEARRLLNRPLTDPLADARALAGLGARALLKGAATVIMAEDGPVISAKGTSGMAKGGSGDCLSGIIGALMAQNPSLDPAECAVAGCLLHGAAGELARARRGVRGMTPADLIDALPEVLRRYE